MNQRRRSAVALRHVAFEDLGLLAPVLAREGFDVVYRDAAVEELLHDSIANADLLVVLGAPIGAYETDAYPFLKSELALIEHRLSRDLPTLGICLGAQLMASALGSRVFAGPVKEIGWGHVELAGDGAASCLNPLGEADAVVLHWHATLLICQRTPKGWRRTRIIRIKRSPMAATRSGFSFISKPIPPGWSNGMSAMPLNSARRRSRLLN
jgi:GMP synthase-like glutamine amidotransferase